MTEFQLHNDPLNNTRKNVCTTNLHSPSHCTVLQYACHAEIDDGWMRMRPHHMVNPLGANEVHLHFTRFVAVQSSAHAALFVHSRKSREQSRCTRANGEVNIIMLDWARALFGSTRRCWRHPIDKRVMEYFNNRNHCSRTSAERIDVRWLGLRSPPLQSCSSGNSAFERKEVAMRLQWFELLSSTEDARRRCDPNKCDVVSEPVLLYLLVRPDPRRQLKCACAEEGVQ